MDRYSISEKYKEAFNHNYGRASPETTERSCWESGKIFFSTSVKNEIDVWVEERKEYDSKMPHVEIKCYSGRTDEQKRECAEKIAEVLSQTLGCKSSSVSVAIKDIAPEDWKEKVWDANIVPDEKVLFKKPGYTCE